MQEPFKTSDLGLAAYLSYMGMTVLGCVSSGEAGRLFFVFTDVDGSKQLVENWTSGHDEVSASRYMRALRQCKRRLQDPVT